MNIFKQIETEDGAMTELVDKNSGEKGPVDRFGNINRQGRGICRRDSKRAGPIHEHRVIRFDKYSFPWITIHSKAIHAGNPSSWKR